jgi:hypothetical protein
MDDQLADPTPMPLVWKRVDVDLDGADELTAVLAAAAGT